MGGPVYLEKDVLVLSPIYSQCGVNLIVLTHY